MKTFLLPDLGEGLPDAEIVEWLVEEGAVLEVDQPMVSMETAKAVVEVPSPFSGKLTKVFGKAGDVIKTGAPLAEFQVADDGASEDAEPTSDDQKTVMGDEASEKREDSGTVVGNVEAGNEVLKENLATVGEFKMTPAVRALARKLKVDPAYCVPSGAGGVITAEDVRKAAANGAPAASARAHSTPTPPIAAEPPSGEWEPLRGTRRTMARAMSESHAQVVPTTLMDDADIHHWHAQEDITARLLRALWVGAQSEPGLNAWFDGDQGMRLVHKVMHVGMAIDTPEGLMVAALKNVHAKDGKLLRQDINRLRDNASNRSIPPEELKDFTIVLSNFGKFAGRYATPVITPPCVAIVAAGKLRHEVVPVLGGVEVHRMMPLSLTFDHRACTGGEAARFLHAMLLDLSKPH